MGVSGISLLVEGCLGRPMTVGEEREQQGKGAFLGLSQPERTHPGGQPAWQGNLRKRMRGASWGMTGKGAHERLLRICSGSHGGLQRSVKEPGVGGGELERRRERTHLPCPHGRSLRHLWADQGRQEGIELDTSRKF